MWWLFAHKIEGESRAELGVVVVIVAICANVLQWYVTGPHFGGLSGVVYGLMSYCWCLNRYAGKKAYMLDSGLCLALLALIPIAMTGALGKFAHFAHIGGLIAGVIAGVIVAYGYNKLR